jgi:hypothetical protein
LTVSPDVKRSVCDSSILVLGSGASIGVAKFPIESGFHQAMAGTISHLFINETAYLPVLN